jgi:hypothetical protein
MNVFGVIFNLLFPNAITFSLDIKTILFIKNTSFAQ